MLTSLIILINRACTAAATVLLAPVGRLPGWVSLGMISAITGVAMLWVFKHTSNQAAIKRARNQIAHNKLALSLFGDNLWVGLKSQASILAAAGRLMVLAVPSLIAMSVPTIFLLGQLGLWYQARPLKVGEEAVLTVRLASSKSNSMSSELVVEPQLQPTQDIDVTVGPVRVPSRQMISWNIAARQPGLHSLQFRVGDQMVDKQLAVGSGFMPVSIKRPDSTLQDLLLHPQESPFGADSVVRSIDITYPERDSYASGTNWWIGYWLILSMAAAFAVKPLLKVNV